MAKKDPTFEELIKMVDKLPNDMPQDYSYRKKKNKKSEERAPVKVNKPSVVESKISNTVNNMVETNNKFQNTQNHITHQQTEINKDQLHEDRKQTGLLQQQQSILSGMSDTMSRLFQMMKRQADKLTPKIQEKAADKKFEAIGQPKAPVDVSDSLAGLTDLFGGGRRKRKRLKPTRQKRADARRSRRAKPSIPSSPGNTSAKWSARASTLGTAIKARGGNVLNSLKTRGGAIVDNVMTAAKNTKGSTKAKIGAGILAGGAAMYGGHTLLKGEFGSIAEKHETSGRGVSTVSTGKGDNGGVSYGKYQLSTKTGTMKDFVKSEQGREFAPYFEGLTPGSAEFTAVYNKLAKEKGAELGRAQHNYIRDTHYDPAMVKLQKNGIDFSQRSRALNELVFSSSTQYGASGAPDKIMRALKGQDVSTLTDAQIITMIQDDKLANVNTDFVSSSQNTRNGVAGRTQREKADLLAMLQAEHDVAAGIDRAEVERIRGETEEKKDTNVASVQPMSSEGPIGIFKTPTQDEASGINPSTALALGGGAAIVGATVAKRGASPMSMGDIKGKEQIPTNQDQGQPDFERMEGQTRTKEIAKAKKELSKASTPNKVDAPKTTGTVGPKVADGVKAKGLPKGLNKAIPGVGIALTGAEAVSIITDDSMTGKEKARAGTGLAGGTAGAIAGGKAGAAGGAATGAAIGSLFFGVGAAPGAVIGGVLGGIGGSVLGYYGGEYLATEGFDAVDGAMSPDPEVVNATHGSVTPDSNLMTEKSESGIPISLLDPRKQKEKEAKAKQKIVVMHAPVVPTKATSSLVASTPKRAEPVEAVEEPQPFAIRKDKVTTVILPASVASVDKAEPIVASGNPFSALQDHHNQTLSVSPKVESYVPSSTTPTSAPLKPKQTTAAWSALPQATPQRVAEVSTSHETPMAREAYTSVTPVNVENPSAPVSSSGQPERISGSGISESNSVRPELKDVPPMVTDFGIVFLNAGLI